MLVLWLSLLTSAFAQGLPPRQPLGAGAFIDNRVDVHAQYVLGRLDKGTNDQKWLALFIISSVHNGALEGLYKEDLGVPALRAKAMGIGWWDILKGGLNSRCWTDPPGKKPMVVFANKIRSIPATMDTAIVDAWMACGFGGAVVDLGVSTAWSYVGPNGVARSTTTPRTRFAIGGPPGVYTVSDTTGKVLGKVTITGGKFSHVKLGGTSALPVNDVY